jgi:serine/threonine-protein kinase
MGQVVEQDAGLTTELLRYVNSTAFGCRDKACTAQEAVVRLGTRVTPLYLTTIGLKRLLKISQWRMLDFDGFWCANLERALFAREIAHLLGTDGDVAFSGAILCDCLLPLLTNRATRTYLRYMNDQPANAASLPEFEEREFGWNHARAAALLLRGWKLPSELVCCVLLHHKGLEILKDPAMKRTSAAAVALSGLLPDPLRQEPRGLGHLRDLDRVWPAFDLLELAYAVQRRFAELEPSLTNPTPLVGRILKARRAL